MFTRSTTRLRSSVRSRWLRRLRFRPRSRIGWVRPIASLRLSMLPRTKGAALRAVGRAARGGGGGGAPARRRAGEAARPRERRRARALLAATTRGGGAAVVLAPLAGRAAARLGSERPSGERRLP